MTEQHRLIERLSVRIAQYCDALGYDDEDLTLLAEAEALTGRHLGPTRDHGMNIPDRRYSIEAEMIITKRRAWDRVARGKKRISQNITLEDVDISIHRYRDAMEKRGDHDVLRITAKANFIPSQDEIEGYAQDIAPILQIERLRIKQYRILLGAQQIIE